MKSTRSTKCHIGHGAERNNNENGWIVMTAINLMGAAIKHNCEWKTI
jgi:hypothetical protein